LRCAQKLRYHNQGKGFARRENFHVGIDSFSWDATHRVFVLDDRVHWPSHGG
jgi:hypothetical protein